jgi:hypothetical protein
MNPTYPDDVARQPANDSPASFLPVSCSLVIGQQRRRFGRGVPHRQQPGAPLARHAKRTIQPLIRIVFRDILGNKPSKGPVSPIAHNVFLDNAKIHATVALD